MEDFWASWGAEEEEKEEAIAETIQLVLSPAQNLVASMVGPGRTVASCIKSIEEKLEKGEEITKVG